MVAEMAEWSIAVGIFTYIIALVFAGIYYFKYKKIFLISYIVSIATYIFAVFYTWDIFEPNRNWILLMLSVSVFIMIFLGKHFAKIELKKINNTKNKDVKTHKKSGKANTPIIHLFVLVILILIFFAIIGVATMTNNVDIQYTFEDEIVYGVEGGKYNYKLGEVVITNNGYLSSRVELKKITGCFFDNEDYEDDVFLTYSNGQKYYYNDIRAYKVDVNSGENMNVKLQLDYLPLGINRKGDINITKNATYYDLYLFEIPESMNRYSFCENINKEDAFKIVKVMVE